jgi:transformation/transcription domain-associated protein
MLSSLERTYRRFFQNPEALQFQQQNPSAVANNPTLIATRRFAEKYQTPFEHDFLPGHANSPQTLTELARRLKRWKTHLATRLNRYSLTHVKLQRVAPALNRMTLTDVEMPCQYKLDEEPMLEQHALLVRLEPDVLVLHPSPALQARRLGFRGSDGRLQHFAVQTAFATLMRADERLAQMHVIFNRLMGKYKETRKRHLCFDVNQVVPLGNRMRLSEAPEDSVLLSEV